MRNRNICASASAALVIGFAHSYLVIFCWGYISAHAPVLRWLLDLGLRDASLRIVLYPIDFATNVVLSLPAALLLVKIGRSKLPLLLALAVVPAFIWHHYQLIGTSVLAEYWSALLFGWLQELLALPVAALLIHFLSGPRTPNNVLQDGALNARA